MSSATDARIVLERLRSSRPNNTQIRTIAKELGRNAKLAADLWNSGEFSARMLSLLIQDIKTVDVPRIENFIADIEGTEAKEQSQLLDWMIANVVMKKAALKKETANWRAHPSALKQRVFWSVQARSIRAGDHEQNERLLEHIERDLPTASGTVAWNMNWCAAQIGIADEQLRGRCIALGERLGLYRDYPVPKGCTSPFLPLWIGGVVSRQAPA